MRAQKIRQAIIIAFLLAGFIILMVPLLWCISLSFDRSSLTALPEFSLIPHEFSTYNYEAAMKMIPLMRYFSNTLFLTVVNTAISVFFACACGYAFAKGQFAGKNFWFIFMLIVMMIPFESRMIPLYIQYRNWGMLDSYLPLILGNFSYVYGMFFARQNISGLPDALRESAYLDGAGEWAIFFRIILPLSKPLIATLCILQVIVQWNNYLWPMIVIRTNARQVLSVGVALFNAQENAYYYGPRMAVAVLSAIPLTILYLLLQKYIVQSIAFSGIKS